jgi:hypothetical protein
VSDPVDPRFLSHWQTGDTLIGMVGVSNPADPTLISTFPGPNIATAEDLLLDNRATFSSIICIKECTRCAAHCRSVPPYGGVVRR